jgi:hypothetical protein
MVGVLLSDAGDERAGLVRGHLPEGGDQGIGVSQQDPLDRPVSN